MGQLTKDSSWAAQHVLIIGQTKQGKTRWVAEAAKDGYELIYVDSDNGLPTIQEALRDDEAALGRIHYFAPRDMEGFVSGLLNDAVFRWNETQNREFSRTSAAPTDKMVEIFPSRIPQRVILVIDSWTSLCYSILRNKAKRDSIDLTDIEKYDRSIYGGAGFRATQIAQTLQYVKFGVIVQAHPAFYERKEKPTGTVGQINEKDMIIKETIRVPLSTSMPHGYTLGKFFNQIQNMYTDRADRRIIDFTTHSDSIGGGTPNSKGDPMTTHRFAKLFGMPPEVAEPTWIQYLTVEEYMARANANNKPAAPAPTPVEVPVGEPKPEDKTPTPTPTPKIMQPKLTMGKLKIPIKL